MIVNDFGRGTVAQPPADCYFTRQIDGRCNNYANPDLGAEGRYFKHGPEGTNYVDGVREPVMTPNFRTVSNNLFRSDETVLSPHGHNLLWTFFGQFITHDMMGVHRMGDLNASEIPDSNNSAVWTRVPLEQPDDALFVDLPPFGAIPVPYIRLLNSRGDMVNGKFEIGSDSTAWLDLDTVYGKTESVSTLLRSHTDGLLKTHTFVNYSVIPGSASRVPATYVGSSDGEWLPTLDEVGGDRFQVPLSLQLVLTNVINIGQRALIGGDGRAGENYGLMAIQVLFLREHNRLARQFKAKHPYWTDEQLFQAARRINIAQYQAIIYNEFLPSILLVDNVRVGPYHGYDATVDPTCSHLFAFAFRFGHTTVPNVYGLKNRCNKPAFNSTRDGPRSGQSFGGEMHADQIAQVGKPSNIWHAMLFEKSRKVDPQFPESLRTVRGANTDIIAANQFRAAEHGIPGYNNVRKHYHGAPFADLYDYPLCSPGRNSPGPDPLACFLFINSNITIANTLRNLYGKIDKINFYTAVVAEEPRLAAIGQTSARIIAEQMKRIRDADRWFFEGNDAGFTRLEVLALKYFTKFSHILSRNFPEVNVPADAFYAPNPWFFNSCSA